MLNETLGKWHFWLLFIGFHTTFLIQHWLGVVGMPRRYASYLPEDGVTWMHQLSTVGAAHPGRLDDSVLPQRLPHRTPSAEGHRERPLGLRPVARVGDELPTAADTSPPSRGSGRSRRHST